MSPRLATLVACVLALSLAGCTGSGSRPEPVTTGGPPVAPAGPASSLDADCVTAVGADRNPCQAR